MGSVPCTVLHFNTCGEQVSKWNCGWWLGSSSYPTTKIDLLKPFVRFVSVAWKTRARTQYDRPWGNSIFFELPMGGGGGKSTWTSLNKWPYHWVHFSNGLRANLYGPIAGHHAFELHESNLIPRLDGKFRAPHILIRMFSLYGDPAYPLRQHLLAPYRGAIITPAQELFNKRMSKILETVEWAFGKVVQYFSFLDFGRKPQSPFATSREKLCRGCSFDTAILVHMVL